MYAALKHVVARVLKAPTEPPRLPEGDYATAEVLRASPRWLAYRLLSFYIAISLCVLGLLAALIATIAAGEWLAILAVAAAAAVLAFFLGLAWFAVRLDYDLRYYVLTDRSLRVREGAWNVAEMTLTYANVQNVRVEQGPLMRLFGVQDVVVDTAGGGVAAHPGRGGSGGHRIVLAGLEDAPRVRDLVLAHVRRFGKSSGLGDRDDPGERGPGASLASREVELALERLFDGALCLRAAAEHSAGPNRA